MNDRDPLNSACIESLTVEMFAAHKIHSQSIDTYSHFLSDICLPKKHTSFMKDFSYITQSHPAYIESLYKDYVQDPDSVDPEFRKFFEGFDFAISNGVNGHPVAVTEPLQQALQLTQINWERNLLFINLVLAYRKKGHLVANTNPIRKRKDRGANLDLNFFGLSDADLQQTFSAGKFIGLENATLQQIVDRLKRIYCGHIGVEYQYISRPGKN